jgi:hypothetical protein
MQGSNATALRDAVAAGVSGRAGSGTAGTADVSAELNITLNF